MPEPASLTVAVRARPWEQAVAVLALLLPLAAWDGFDASIWAPKAVLLLLTVVPGALALGALVVRREGAAVAAAAFMVLSGLSTALSDAPLLSFLGDYNAGTGWLFIAAVLGLWALGRHMSTAGRAVLTDALVATVLVSAGVGVLQGYVSDLPSVLRPFPATSQGLTGNSAFLGGLMAMGLCLAVPRVGTTAVRGRWLAAVVLLGAAVQLSAARISLALALVVVLTGVRPCSWPVRAAVGAALVGGMAITSFAPNVTQSGAQRVIATGTSANVSQSDSTRFGTWQLGVSTLPHYAVLGSGPARFGAASLPHMSLAQARRLGASYYSDAHNFVLEYAVTTGFLGLAALAVFLALAGRRARGPLARLAVVGAVVSLFEPQNVVIVPLVLLALGAAGSVVEASPFVRWRGPAALVGIAAAAAAGGWFLHGEALMAQGAVDADVKAAASAARQLPPWPDPDVVAAKAAAFHAVADPNPMPYRTEALSWARAAAADDPALPTSWSLLGDYLAHWSDPAQAGAAFDRAAADNPWDEESLVGLATVEGARGEVQARQAVCRRVAAVVAPKPVPAPCAEKS